MCAPVVVEGSSPARLFSLFLFPSFSFARGREKITYYEYGGTPTAGRSAAAAAAAAAVVAAAPAPLQPSQAKQG